MCTGDVSTLGEETTILSSARLCPSFVFKYLYFFMHPPDTMGVRPSPPQILCVWVFTFVFNHFMHKLTVGKD